MGIDCSICLIFKSQQTAYIGHEAEIFLSLRQGNLKRIKRSDVHVNPWLIHVNVWQKPLQYCKVISLQIIKINGGKKREVMVGWYAVSEGAMGECFFSFFNSLGQYMDSICHWYNMAHL